MKLDEDDVSIRTWQKVGVAATKMVGPRSNGIRSRKDPVPASAPPSAPASVAGSECGVIDFTKEEVEALLIERMKTKNKFNYKVGFVL